MALCGVTVKGSGLGNTQKYIREKYGQAVLDKVYAAMAEPARTEVAKSLATAWYPVEHIADFIRAIKSVIGPNDQDINFKISNESAKYTFSLIYKVFFKLGSPQFIMGKVSSVWSTLCSGGKLEITDKSDKHLVLRLSDFAYRDPEYCGQRLRGWFQAPLELSGCQIVENRHTACASKGASYCEWRIAWK